MWLRQSTASQEILLGTFLDSTDGNTPMTALTILNTDIKLWFEGATTKVNKNSGGATPISGGDYYAVLDATDTATVGKCEITVHVAGALAVRRSFMILPAVVYDALVLGTDFLQVDVKQVNGTDAATSDGTAQAGAAGTITLASGASSTNSIYVDRTVTITGGTGAGQSRIITAYNGTTKVATVHRNWDTNPDNTSTYSIGATAVAASVAAGGITSTSFGSGAIDATAFAQAAADKAWSTASRLLTAGTNIVLAKGTGVTGFNDIAATAIVSGGAITTSSGAVSTVTTTTTATNVTTVNGLAAGVITASSIAADAITDAKVASDVTIASVTGAVGSVTAAVALTSGERSTLAGVVRDVNNATPAANSLGAAINSAASAGDPWATTLPGAYEEGTAGHIIGTNLDETVGSRSAPGTAQAIDMTQTVPTSNTAQTVGDALNAARAQAFGRWVKSGTSLVLYAANGSTVVRTFTLDDADVPTSRT